MLNYMRKTFRIWWQKPRVASDFSVEREVTFLELFYDLVFVVIIAEVAHHLTYHLSWGGLAEFGLMMLFVLWAWLNGTLYHILHGNNDISMRIFTFLQMFLVGAMTVFVGELFSDGAAGFAIVFALFQVLFAALWYRTGYHDSEHRAVSNPYAAVYALSATAMFWSATLENSQTVLVLSIVIGVNLLMPAFTYFNRSSRQAAITATQGTSDGVERMGLITIVALGEVVVSSINGVNDLSSFTLRAGIVGSLGIFIAIAMWWFYFDFISRRLPKKGFWNNQLFIYFHIPLIAAIAASGGVLRDMISHNDDLLESTTRWIFVLAVAVVVFASAFTMRTVNQHTKTLQKYADKGSLIAMLCAVIILTLGSFNLGHIGLLAAVSVVLILPVFYGVGAWIRSQNSSQ